MFRINHFRGAKPTPPAMEAHGVLLFAHEALHGEVGDSLACQPHHAVCAMQRRRHSGHSLDDALRLRVCIQLRECACSASYYCAYYYAYGYPD